MICGRILHRVGRHQEKGRLWARRIISHRRLYSVLAEMTQLSIG